jgi:signal transduction histidine kinase
VRWRLALLYGGLFLACGAALLAVTYTLVHHATTIRSLPTVTVPGAEASVRPGQAPPGAQAAVVWSRRKREARLAPGPGVPVPASLQRLISSPGGRLAIKLVGDQQRAFDLHQLEIESGIALAIMALVSSALGWAIAGRVLRPLRTITAAAQQISEHNLHQRLALPGPRDELRALADTIDGLLERLEAAFESQRRFVANASHELRTPLTAARALLEMTLSDPDATVDAFRHTCREALEEGEEQERLIDALLTLARSQRGIEQAEPIDLAAIAGEVVQAHELDATARGVHLDVSLTSAAAAGDPRLIERLVSNLVENAIRYNIPHGRVRIEADTQAGHATLTIANTGPFVPENEVHRLLQPFQRRGPDRVGRRDGLGLGLSIVVAIATAYEATLDVQPGAGGGLHIEVRFPPPVADGSTPPATRITAAVA